MMIILKLLNKNRYALASIKLENMPSKLTTTINTTSGIIAFNLDFFALFLILKLYNKSKKYNNKMSKIVKLTQKYCKIWSYANKKKQKFQKHLKFSISQKSNLKQNLCKIWFMLKNKTY